MATRATSRKSAALSADAAVERLATLTRERADLESRLRRGEEVIAAAREVASPRELRRYEDTWIGLLERYEQVSDEIASLESLATSAAPADS